MSDSPRNFAALPPTSRRTVTQTFRPFFYFLVAYRPLCTYIVGIRKRVSEIGRRARFCLPHSYGSSGLIVRYACFRFLFNKQSAAYQQYRQIVEQFRSELNSINEKTEYQPEDIYEPENATDDENELKRVSNANNFYEFHKKNILFLVRFRSWLRYGPV